MKAPSVDVGEASHAEGSGKGEAVVASGIGRDKPVAKVDDDEDKFFYPESESSFR